MTYELNIIGSGKKDWKKGKEVILPPEFMNVVSKAYHEKK
jgi:hypothetical protein